MSPADVLLSTRALREIEQRAFARLGDPFELMQRAGRDAWLVVLQHWPSAQSLLVICGPGNNGGDGYVLAARACESGRHVRVLCLPDHQPRTAESRRAREQYLAVGGQIAESDCPIPHADLLVDAVFGIGLARALDEPVARLVSAINAHAAPVLALDVPTGVVADTGAVSGVAVFADRTLEFIAAKAGLRTGAARDFTGDLQCTALGLSRGDLQTTIPDIEWLRATNLTRWLQPRLRDSHKGSNGRLLCLGGDHGHGGAIMLTAEAGLRTGCGLVDVVTRDLHIAPLLGRLPEAMVHGDSVDSAQLDSLLAAASAITIGPGLGRTQWAHRLLQAAVTAGRPMVLDADALNLVAAGEATVPEHSVLTPHPGEAARLLQTDIASIQADRFAAARELVARYRAVVVLKGAGTIVAGTCEEIRLVDAGNPGMAVGGMGDVLAGVIGALLAQGLTPLEAASCGALLHSVAGDAAAASGGQRGLLPSDLMPLLRRYANPGSSK